MKVKKVAHYGRMRDFKSIQIGEVIEIEGDNCPPGFKIIEEPKPRARKAKKEEAELSTEENN